MSLVLLLRWPGGAENVLPGILQVVHDYGNLYPKFYAYCKNVRLVPSCAVSLATNGIKNVYKTASPLAWCNTARDVEILEVMKFAKS